MATPHAFRPARLAGMVLALIAGGGCSTAAQDLPIDRSPGLSDDGDQATTRLLERAAATWMESDRVAYLCEIRGVAHGSGHRGRFVARGDRLAISFECEIDGVPAGVWHHYERGTMSSCESSENTRGDSPARVHTQGLSPGAPMRLKRSVFYLGVVRSLMTSPLFDLGEFTVEDVKLLDTSRDNGTTLCHLAYSVRREPGSGYSFRQEVWIDADVGVVVRRIYRKGDSPLSWESDFEEHYRLVPHDATSPAELFTPPPWAR